MKSLSQLLKKPLYVMNCLWGILWFLGDFEVGQDNLPIELKCLRDYAFHQGEIHFYTKWYCNVWQCLTTNIDALGVASCFLIVI